MANSGRTVVIINEFKFRLPWGFPKGRYVISPYAQSSKSKTSIIIANPFFKSVKQYQLKNGNFILLDREGNRLYRNSFTKIREPHCGLCQVEWKSKYEHFCDFINNRSEMIFQQGFTSATNFDDNTQTAIAFIKNYKYRIFPNGRMDLIENKHKKKIVLSEQNVRFIVRECVRRILIERQRELV